MASRPEPAAGRSRRAPPRLRGRPTIFKAAIAETICDRLADGETLRKICKDDRMPSRSTVSRWLLRHEEFRKRYTHARDLQADLLAEEVIDIADDRAGDVIITHDGKKIVDWENVQRSRLRCDSRKWFSAKIAPKRYSERISQELSGPNGGPIATESYELPPANVASAVSELLGDAEKQLGISSTGRHAERIKRILASGGPPPPAIYAALYANQSRSGKNANGK